MTPDAPIVITPQLDAMRAALAACTFLPGSAHKRFARDILHALALTEAQHRHLVRLCFRYRRQMPRDLVPSGDAVQAMDADWNMRRKAAAEREAADRGAARYRRRIARAGGVQLSFDSAQLARIGLGDD